MALESATYISDLVSSNPAATDGIRQGDDHIRLIKAALKATFPNINGAVTATDEALNSLAIIPVGVISLWYGSSGSVPTGWAICNGSTVNKSDGSGTVTVPDLRDRVVIGAGSTYATGATGGATTASGISTTAGAHTHTATTSSGGSHDHGGATGSTTLTTAQLPAHSHLTVAAGISGVTLSGGNSLAAVGSIGGDNEYTSAGTASTPTLAPSSQTGSGSGHTHSISSDGSHTHTATTTTAGDHNHSTTVSTLQPFRALFYIMKV